MSADVTKNQLPVAKLRALCQGIVPVPETVDSNIPVTGIVADSRRVEPGNCFVAISGYQTDGHVYVDEAVARGAACLIVENKINQKNVPVLYAEDTRSALALLAKRYFGNPSEAMQLIGITGTNGKSTTAMLVESIFQTAGQKTGLIGTMTYRWSGFEAEAERTTPESVDIQRMFWEMKNHGIETVVMEVSSHALQLNRVLGLEFKAAVFTNLTRDHMDFHGTLTEYENAKARLFQMIKKDGIGVLNGDDPAGERIQKRATGRTVLFGENNVNVDYRIQEIRKDNQGMHFMVHFQDKTIKLITPLWGHFNMMNAAAAAVTGLETGLDPDTVRQGIQKVDCVKGRMEGFLAPGGFRVIVDYAHSPDALKNLLMATRELTEKRILAVFGCGGDRDKGKRSHMGQIGAAFADVVFVTSDNPRSETPESIIKDILKGIPSDRPIQVIEDRREAIYQALDQAEPGDTVVLAGKGHETYQQIGTKKYSFSDRKVAEEHLGLTARA